MDRSLGQNEIYNMLRNLHLLYILYISNYTMAKRIASSKTIPSWVIVSIVAVVLLIIGGLFWFLPHGITLKEGLPEEGVKVRETTVEDDIIPFTEDNIDCYVINLKKNPDRMVQFTTNYGKTDLAKTNPIIRSEGVYGKEIPYTDYISEKPVLEMLPGMVGCFLSHLDLYETISDGKKPYGIIFEDDANVDPLIYYKTIRHLNVMVPPDWDIILLGYFDYDKTHQFIQLETCKRAISFWGTHGYIVNRKSAEKLQYHMQPPFNGQIDHVMSKLSRDGKINIYAVNQPVVWQNAKYSDVQPPSKLI